MLQIYTFKIENMQGSWLITLCNTRDKTLSVPETSLQSQPHARSITAEGEKAKLRHDLGRKLPQSHEEVQNEHISSANKTLAPRKWGFRSFRIGNTSPQMKGAFSGSWERSLHISIWTRGLNLSGSAMKLSLTMRLPQFQIGWTERSKEKKIFAASSTYFYSQVWKLQDWAHLSIKQTEENAQGSQKIRHCPWNLFGYI